ncbi:MAG: HepT-like ribonuclease domain-containing protein [Armatimonadota bacterium]
MLPKEDVIRLRHMLDAAEMALNFTRARSRHDLDGDPMLSFAVVRAIEIIGEAAGKIAAPTQAAIQELPWPAIIAMRNRIIHAYFDIDHDRVWDTVTSDLPPLITILRDILSREAT